MQPIQQTQLHSVNQNGNCLRAAIASILEIDIDSIPRFEDMGERWFSAFREWSRVNGYEVQVYHPSIVPVGYALAAGMSPRGVYHCVVAFNGEVVHDPHPSEVGLVSIDRYWVFVKV